MRRETAYTVAVNRVDFGWVMFSDVSDELIATTYVDDRERMYFRDKSFEKDYQLIRGQLGDLRIGFGSSQRSISR